MALTVTVIPTELSQVLEVDMQDQGVLRGSVRAATAAAGTIADRMTMHLNGKPGHTPGFLLLVRWCPPFG